MECKDALLEAGVAEEDVRFELFTAAGAFQTKTTAAVDAGTSSDAVPMQVVLDGVTTSLELSKDKNMLDAALDAGLDAPYSCWEESAARAAQIGGRQGFDERQLRT